MQPGSASIRIRPLRRALVTGATGFLGGHLVARLRGSGVAVRALVRNPGAASALAALGVELAQGDLTRPEALDDALAGIDTVFHAAGIAGPGTLSAEDFRAVNATGTRRLIAACLASGTVERFVHVSSVAVDIPGSAYGASKREAEAIVNGAAGGHFSTVIARPSIIYGTGSKATQKLFSLIARRRLLLVGSARNRIQPLWVDDVVDGLWKCATTVDAAGGTYVLAGAQPLTSAEACREIAAACGVSLWPVRVPMGFASAMAFACERAFALVGAKPPLDRHKIDFFRLELVHDIAKARDELGWSPRQSFADGARRYAAWLRERL